MPLKFTILLILVVAFNSVIGQNSASKNISDFIQLLDSNPTEKQVEQLKTSLTSMDTLEYSLAISILFKYDPDEYRTQMIDAFSILYLDTKRATVNKFYKDDELLKINKEITKQFDKKYNLTKKDKDEISLLYTFIEYRKRNIWTYHSEQFSIPTTIAIRGGYLKSLLEKTMDYRNFISMISASEKANYEKNAKD